MTENAHQEQSADEALVLEYCKSVATYLCLAANYGGAPCAIVDIRFPPRVVATGATWGDVARKVDAERVLAWCRGEIPRSQRPLILGSRNQGAR
jgi:hypothetical protein